MSKKLYDYGIHHDWMHEFFYVVRVIADNADGQYFSDDMYTRLVNATDKFEAEPGEFINRITNYD